jgi:phosphopentomutase
MGSGVTRFIIIVLDSVGIGALPDASDYGDVGANTLGHVASSVGGLNLKNLAKLGIGNLGEFLGIPPLPPQGVACKVAMQSPGKDTITGHWEMGGIILKQPFKTFPTGFPSEIINAFSDKIGRGVLGNKPASGTEIIEELGNLHIETKKPIVYTSADSVFQIACHEDVVDLNLLYGWCQTARELLNGDNLVARVIARPFVGKKGSFKRTANRRDFSVEPTEPTLLDYAKEKEVTVTAIGKINDIFTGRGIDNAIHTEGNAHGLSVIRDAVKSSSTTKSLIIANLVDFDMLFGHRNNVKGYAQALKEFDCALPGILDCLKPFDVLAITADHGCDPTTSGTDHSREYVPLLITGEKIKRGTLLETRETLADLGATVADILGFDYKGEGSSMANLILE